EMFSEVATIGKAVVLATTLMAVYIYGSDTPVALTIVFSTAVLDLAVLTGYRAVAMKVTERHTARGRGIRNVLIVGAGKVGQALAAYMEQSKPQGLVMKGFLDSEDNDDPRLLGKIEDFSIVVRTHFVDEVFVTIPSERQVVRSLVAEGQQH